jgi:hypothetical protein
LRIVAASTPGVILIDPGSSLQAGRLLLRRVRAITDKPASAVFNSHIHGLYWLGNQAMREQYPEVPVYAHKRMIARIEQGQGDFWVNAITGDYDSLGGLVVDPEVPSQGLPDDADFRGQLAATRQALDLDAETYMHQPGGNERPSRTAADFALSGSGDQCSP